MTQTQKKGKRSRIHKSAGSWAFDLFNYLLLTLFCLTILLPFWYLLVLSFDEFGNVTAQDFFLWPRAFTLENYKTVAENPASLARRACVLLSKEEKDGTNKSTSLFKRHSFPEKYSGITVPSA